MTNNAYRYLFLILLGVGLCNPTASNSAAEEQQGSHKTIAGIVTQGPGGLRIKTVQGNTYQLNEMDQRHELEPFKEGDEVTVMVDENNIVIDIHPKGQEGNHRFVTGKLIYVGKMKNEIKLQTPEGEKIFPLAHLEIKTKGLAEGTPVTVELNEAGTVVDLHRAEGGSGKH
jgi:hypothetical protein